MHFRTTACFLIGVIAASAGPVQAGPAEMASRAHAEGQARLAEADFAGALTAFKAAAKSDRENAEYTQDYAVLRQIMRLRESLPKEQDAERWFQGAAALTAFYHQHGLYAESLSLDEERYRRDPSTESAILLARTQLALGSNSLAAASLGALPKEHQTVQARVLLGLALARDGRTDEAKLLAADPGKVEADAGAQSFYELACVWALVARPQEALRSLTRSIELTPPSQVDDLKGRIKRCPDLQALSQTSEFAEVMKTASKVQESPCSGGTGCSKCPKREKCGSAKSAEASPKP